MARTRRCSIGLRHFHVAGQKLRALFWGGLGALVVAVVAVATFEILLSRAEPILRARLLQSLSARFHSRVEMGAFDVSLLRGFEVSGKDLAIYPYNIDSTTPTFSVRRFAFRTGYRSLVRSPMHISHVEVEGLRINLPPKSQRKALPRLNTSQGKGSNASIIVGELDCTDTVLSLGTDKPGKLPQQFVIQSLKLRSIV